MSSIYAPLTITARAPAGFSSPDFASYNDWSVDNANDPDELTNRAEYADYVRKQYIANGNFDDPQNAAQIEESIRQNTREAAIADEVEGAAERMDSLFAPKAQPIETKLAFIKQYSDSNSEEWKSAEAYLAHQTSLTQSGLEGNENPLTEERTLQYQQEAEALAGGAAYQKALRAAVDRGDMAMARLTDENGQSYIHSGKLLDTISFKDAIQQSVAMGGMAYSDAAAARSLYSVDAKYNEPYHKVRRWQEQSNVLEKLSLKNKDLGKSMQGLQSLYAEMEDDGEKSPEFQAKEEAAIAKVYESMISTGAYDKDTAPDFEDISRAASNMAQMNNFYNGEAEAAESENVGKNIRRIGYNNLVMHPAAMLNKKMFDASIKANQDLTPSEINMLTRRREFEKEQNFSEYNERLANDSVVGDKWITALQIGRTNGQKDADTLDEFINNEDNYSSAKGWLSGIWSSVEEGVSDLAAAVGVMTGNTEWALPILQQNARDKASRREMSALFGKEYGFGRNAVEMLAPVLTDMAATALLSIPTAGAGGAGYLIAKQGATLTAKGIAKGLVTNTFRRQVGEGAEAAAQRLVTEKLIRGSSETVKLKGAKEALDSFNNLTARRWGVDAAVFVPASTRSGGMTYGSVYTQLQQDNPDATHEENHDKAMGAAMQSGLMTGLTTVAFGRLGFGGVEDALVRGATYGQLKRVLEPFVKKTGTTFDDAVRGAYADAMKQTGMFGLRTGLAKVGLKGTTGDVLAEGIKGAVSEAPEEALQEFLDGLISDAATDSETPFAERISQSFNAALYGAVLGGAITTGKSLATAGNQLKIDQQVAPQMVNSFQSKVADKLEESGSPLMAEQVRSVLFSTADTQVAAFERARQEFESDQTQAPFMDDMPVDQPAAPEPSPERQAVRAELEQAELEFDAIVEANPVEEGAEPSPEVVAQEQKVNDLRQQELELAADDQAAAQQQDFAEEEEEAELDEDPLDALSEAEQETEKRLRWAEANIGDGNLSNVLEVTASRMEDLPIEDTAAIYERALQEDLDNPDDAATLEVIKNYLDQNTTAPEVETTTTAPIQSSVKRLSDTQIAELERASGESGDVTLQGRNATVLNAEDLAAEIESEDRIEERVIEIMGSSDRDLNESFVRRNVTKSATALAKKLRAGIQETAAPQQETTTTPQQPEGAIIDFAEARKKLSQDKTFDQLDELMTFMESLEEDGYLVAEEFDSIAEVAMNSSPREAAVILDDLLKQKDKTVNLPDSSTQDPESRIKLTPQKQEAPTDVEVATDPAERQQLINAIAEGGAILNSGQKTNGEPMTEGELEVVQRSLDNASARLGYPTSLSAAIARRGVTEEAAAPEPLTSRQSNFLRERVIVNEGDPRYDQAKEVSSGPGFVRVVIQNNLAELVDSKPVYHETNLTSAKQLIQRVEAGPRRLDSVYVTDNIDIALGQAGRGYVMEFDSTKVNGKVANTMSSQLAKAGVVEGTELILDTSVRGSLQAIIVPNQRGLNALAKVKGIEKRFDLDNATQVERGIRIPRRAPDPVVEQEAEIPAVTNEDFQRVLSEPAPDDVVEQTSAEVDPTLDPTAAEADPTLQQPVEEDPFAQGELDFSDMTPTPEQDEQLTLFQEEQTKMEDQTIEAQDAAENLFNDRSLDSGVNQLENDWESDLSADEILSTVVETAIPYIRDRTPSEVDIVIDETISAPMRMQGNTMTVNPWRIGNEIAKMGGDGSNTGRMLDSIMSEETAHYGGFMEFDSAKVDEMAAAVGVDELSSVAQQYYNENPAMAEESIKKLRSEDPAVAKKEAAIMVEEQLRMKLQRATRGFTTEEDVLFLRSNPSMFEMTARYFEGGINRIAANFDLKTNPHSVVNGQVNKMVAQMRSIKARHRMGNAVMTFNPNNPNQGLDTMLAMQAETANIEEQLGMRDLATSVGSDTLDEATLLAITSPKSTVSADNQLKIRVANNTAVYDQSTKKMHGLGSKWAVPVPPTIAKTRLGPYVTSFRKTSRYGETEYEVTIKVPNFGETSIGFGGYDSPSNLKELAQEMDGGDYAVWRTFTNVSPEIQAELNKNWEGNRYEGLATLFDEWYDKNKVNTIKIKSRETPKGRSKEQIIMDQHRSTYGKTARTMLQAVASSPDSKFAELSQLILENHSDKYLDARLNFNANRRRAEGGTSAGIFVDTTFTPFVAVHEYAHVVTQSELDKNRWYLPHTEKRDGKYWQGIKEVAAGRGIPNKKNTNEGGLRVVYKPHGIKPTEYQQEIARLYDLAKQTVPQITKAGENPDPTLRQNAKLPAEQQVPSHVAYGLGNLHEFVAQALSSKDMQEFLNKIPDPEAKGKTLLDRFFNAVAKIMGIPVNRSSVLASTLKATEDIGRMGAAKTTQETGRLSSAPPSERSASTSVGSADALVGPLTEGGLDIEGLKPRASQSQNTQRANTQTAYKGVGNLLGNAPRGKVVDYGAGLGNNTQYIQGDETIQHEPYPKGWTPDTTTTEELLGLHEGTADTVVSNLVYNVIRDPNERLEFWSNIGKLMKVGGQAFVATRSPSQVQGKTSKADLDGWLMNAGKANQTWQRGYTTNDLMGYAQQALGDGYTITQGNFAPSGNGQIIIKKTSPERSASTSAGAGSRAQDSSTGKSGDKSVFSMRSFAFDHTSQMFEVPLMETGGYNPPSNLFAKYVLGDPDVRLTRLHRIYKALNRQGGATIKQFDHSFKKLLTETYGEDHKAYPHEDIATAIGSNAGVNVPKETLNDLEEQLDQNLQAVDADPTIEYADKKLAKQVEKQLHQNRIEVALKAEAQKMRDAQRAAMERIQKDSPELARHMHAMRTELIDTLSGMLKDDYNLGGALGIQVDANMGIYITRSYKMFTELGYREKLRESLITNKKLSDAALADMDTSNMTDEEVVEAAKGSYDDLQQEGLEFFEQSTLESIATDPARIKEFMDGGMSERDAQAEAYVTARDVLLTPAYRDEAYNALLQFVDEYANPDAQNVVASTAGYKVLMDNLREKKDIPEQLRKILGENTDQEQGVNNLLRTYATVFSMVNRQSFLRNILAVGTASQSPNPKRSDKFLMTPSELTEARAEDPETYDLWRPVRGDAKVSEFDPLGNMWGPPDMIDHLNAMTKPYNQDPNMTSNEKLGDSLTKFLHKLTGLSMATKTLGSVSWAQRNAIGNLTVFPMMNGWFRPDKIIKQSKLVWRKRNADEAYAVDAEIQELVGLDILDSNMRMTIMKDLLRGTGDVASLQEEINELTSQEEKLALAGKAGKAWDKTKKIGTRIAELGDSIDGFYKMAYFYNELEILTEAQKKEPAGSRLYQMSPYQLKQEAADKVNRTSQSASYRVAIAQSLSSSPLGLLIAPFIGFTADMFRVPVGIFKVANEEMQSGNAVLRKRGLKRLTGLTGTLATTAALPTVFAQLFGGLDDEDRTTLTEALPPFLKGHSIYYFKMGDELKQIDLTYTNPVAMIVDPSLRGVEQLMKGEYSKATIAMLKGYLGDTFLNEQILAGTVASWWRNKDDLSGKPIYDQRIDNFGEIAMKTFKHIFEKAYEPDTFKRLKLAGQRLGGDDEGIPSNETALGVLASGLKPAKWRDVDLQKEFTRLVYAEKEAKSAVRDTLNGVFRKKPMNEDTIADFYRDYYEDEHKLNTRMYKFVKSFTNMGVDEAYLRNALIKSGYGKRRVNTLLNGYTERPSLTPQMMKNLEDRGLVNRAGTLYQTYMQSPEFRQIE